MLIGSNSAYFPVEFRTPTRQPNQTTPNALSRNQHQLENVSFLYIKRKVFPNIKGKMFSFNN